MKCCCIHLIAISQKILKIFIVEMSLKFTNLRLQSNPPGANDLNLPKYQPRLQWTRPLQSQLWSVQLLLFPHNKCWDTSVVQTWISYECNPSHHSIQVVSVHHILWGLQKNKSCIFKTSHFLKLLIKVNYHKRIWMSLFQIASLPMSTSMSSD